MNCLLGPAPASAGEPGLWWALAVADGAPPEGSAAQQARPVARFEPSQTARIVREAPERLGVPADRIRWTAPNIGGLSAAWLSEGVRVARCHDLALAQRILRARPESVGGYTPVVDLPVEQPQDEASSALVGRAPAGQSSFFDAAELTGGPDASAPDVLQLAAELAAQERAASASTHPARLRLLLAAESQGALIAEEIHATGLPWRADVHERLLLETLGPRPAEGERPRRLQELAGQIASDLGAVDLNPDSPTSVLRALQQAGVQVESTRQGELQRWIEAGGRDREQRRRLLGSTLKYKRLARLWTANGWHWLDEWVREDRFHARYLVGGVVTGRWSAHGGGAMQIPSAVRSAVLADAGQLLTVADASQVEPRILAAMSQDEALAAAGSTPDLYREVAEQGRAAGTRLQDRDRAKVALLGAMYGATTGDSGALLPHLRRLYPRAVGLLERAAAEGERGGQVSTWLGRPSPSPDERWHRAVAQTGTRQDEARAATLRRGQGRFTRNFVVQGTAAEWALCWMGEIRRRLTAAGLGTRLVFFVHDEVVLHGPEPEAEQVRGIVREAAAAAGRLLFGAAPVDFPLTVSSVRCYADA